MTKKGHQKFWWMKIKKFFWETVKLGKFSTESDKFVGNRGEIQNRGKCIIASEGMDAPGGSRFGLSVFAVPCFGQSSRPLLYTLSDFGRFSLRSTEHAGRAHRTFFPHSRIVHSRCTWSIPRFGMFYLWQHACSFESTLTLFILT